MFKWLIGLLCILFFFNTSIFAQGNNTSPVIYRIINRETGGVGGYISVINALTQQEISQISFSAEAELIELTSDKRTAFLAATPFIGTKGLFVIDLLENRIKRQLFNGIGVVGVKQASDGFIWVLLNEDKQIAIVDPQTLITVSRININNNPRDILFSPDGQKAYVSLINSEIQVFDAQRRVFTSNVLGLPSGNTGHIRPMELAISPDGKTLAFGASNIVTLIDTGTLQIIDSFSLPTTSIFNLIKLLFSEDGRTIYIAERDLNVYRYNLPSKEIIKIFTSGRFLVQDIKIAPNSSLVYIIDFRGKTIVDANTNEILLSVEEFPTFQNHFSRSIALAGNFTIGQPPTIQVTSPTANQQLMLGQSFRIQWQTSVAAQSFSIASHKVELSIDGGMTFAAIPGAEQLRADARDFNWTVPNIQVANKAQIRVSTVDLGAKRANSTTGNFTIGMGGGGNNDTQAPTVNFIAPVGGENFNAGSNLAISWMSSDNVGVASQDLSLSTDGGQTFTTTLATGLPGSTQSFNFAIPQTLETNQARLRLIVRDGAGNMAQAITANNFNIQSAVDNVAPTVTISQPTTNQQVMAGQPIQVNWQSTDNRAVISQSLLLSLNGGQSFTQVASFGATDSSFILNNINNLSLTTPQAIVRITATDAAGNTGQANTQFTINPTITQAAFKAKILTINGIGFMSNGANSLQLFINDKLITIAPRSVTNTTFTIKGNKKKLNLIKGSSNSVRLVVDGISSNMGSFMF